MVTKTSENVIKLSGRVDSSNAPQLEKEIMEAIAGEQDSLVIDASELEYISSAGLRVLMRVKKAVKKVSITEVTPAVYDIFEMTGFTQIFDVKKALRFVSVEGLELIGRGGNGSVYRLDKDTMIKSFYNARSVEEIDKGREYARAAFVSGIPTAISYETVRCEDGYGILFELLHAKPLSDVLNEDEEHREEYIDKYIDLLLQLHTTEAPAGLPTLAEAMSASIEKAKPYLTEEEYSGLWAFVNGLPERNTFVHGDFHTHNIMVQDGELILIDMDDVCVGHPVIELGGMLLSYYLLPRLASPEARKQFMRISEELSDHLWNRTVTRYFKVDDQAGIDRINKLLMPYMSFRKFNHSILRTDDPERNKLSVEALRKEVIPFLDVMTENREFLENMPA